MEGNTSTDDISQTTFFKCRECEGNFPVSIKVLYGSSGLPICEYCWEEIYYDLRKAKK